MEKTKCPTSSGDDEESGIMTVSLIELAAASLASAVVAGEVVVALAGGGGGGTTKETDNKHHEVEDGAVDVDREGMNVRLKADGSYVTDADIASQHIIVDALRNVSDKVRLVGEESEEDMKGHSSYITGHEERIAAMFRLAQKEVRIRCNSSSNRNSGGRQQQEQASSQQQPLPLSQVAKGTTIRQEIKDTASPHGHDQHLPPSHQNQNHYDETKDDKFPLHEHHHHNDNNRIDVYEEVDLCRVSVFIDPLDGTKAYTKGDYKPVSILIAIILDQTPCFGVICKPFGYDGQVEVLDTGCVAIYGGTLLGGAWAAGGTNSVVPSRLNPRLQSKTDDETTVTTPSSPSDGSTSETLSIMQEPDGTDGRLPSFQNLDHLPRAVISSSRSKGVVEDFVTHLGEKGMINPTPLLITGAGEKSLRIILRSENEGLWFFPKPGTSLWDVAASDALLRATGGRLTDKHGNDLDYTKSRTEAENEEGVVACYDYRLHAECIRLFREGPWNESQ
mmetsp:Transcript_19242/g.46469  ORF Transcript_19242/g.46469 Transcript_19242/m.46469 type:complete len:504 (+) Transcript_19242:277-1788(+)